MARAILTQGAPYRGASFAVGSKTALLHLVR